MHIYEYETKDRRDFDIKSLSEILGHKNVSFTLNVYGIVSSDIILSQYVACSTD